MPSGGLRCDPRKPFGPGQAVPALANSGLDFGHVSHAWLNATETEMIISTQPTFKGESTLYRLRRDSMGSAFGAPQAIAEVDADARSESDGAMSADGLSLYFIVGWAVPYQAVRSTVSAPFSVGRRVDEDLDTEFMRYSAPHPVASGLYLHRETSSGSNGELVQLLPNQNFPTPVFQAPNMTGYSISRDELRLYYSQAGGGLARATRSRASDPFGSPSSFSIESDVPTRGGLRITWVSEDECELYGVVARVDQGSSLPYDFVVRATRPR